MTPLPTFTRQQLESLAKDRLISLLLAMGHQLAQRAAPIQALAAQWAKNSGNRRKPPSSDGLKKKPKSLPEKGKRQSGGQKGHDGHTLEMVTDPQHIEVHPLISCPNCPSALRRVATVGGSNDQGLSYRRWTSKSVSISRKSRVVAGVRRR